jgi:molecular chaperone DnaJ
MNRAWTDKDFYKVLGVSRTAGDDEIKRAYRKLAQKHHPDANQGNPAAEDRFKEISEAYTTLSDPEQRKEYDEVRRLVESGGFAGFRSSGAGPYGGQRMRVEDLGDLFGGLGDVFGFGGARRGPTRGADSTAELTLSFEEAVKGVTTTVAVRAEAPCSRCGGSGAEPDTSVSTCPTCKGKGTIALNQGVFSFSQPCPQCGGSGRLVTSPCTQCHGRGVETRTRNIRVKIPAGVGDGATIRLPAKGSPGHNLGPHGDLLVTVRVAPHEFFGRKGNDLLLTVPITFTEATLGTKLDLPTLAGVVTVKVPAGTPSGKTFRVRGHGVTPERGKTGDLMAKVEVLIPKRLSKDEKKLIEQLAGYETEDPRAHLGVGTT